MPSYNFYRRLGTTSISNGLVAYYARLGLTEAELVLLLQLEAFFQRGNFFPSNEKIAANTNFTVNDVSLLIQSLLDKDCLQLEQVTDGTGKISSRYSLDKLYDKLDQYLDQHVQVKDESGQVLEETGDSLNNDPVNGLAREFEIEFGRYLTPIEREEIQDWLNLDHYSPEVVRLALREAVLSRAMSFKYVDRILLNWQRMNLKTSSEVQQYLERNR
ncbi:DNA replication protein DnaD [Lactobacillus nasalidis]|uniref:DNA replication protein DnaD n=1 Tax=Lactobacillus nasalidis TaxID=2797258 RepID=A0ABQ3W3W2_9LACO|nr:DnaD domain protein [Lactobacillus nasalidis]GHV98429.1 DNA replication protein DnaD [Lactobacillus nasalidis]GHV98802.1 DNA replication protein DnaD [Lactobacillus nasalidis]GHW01156.1 DNA replication protein DnaD [Lactobacillus nasalidis]